MRILQLVAAGLLSFLLIVLISSFLPQKSSAVQVGAVIAPVTDPAKVESVWRDWMQRPELSESAMAIGE
ncbi:hypothetical protein OS189_09010 [Sulfitobacter sp. F26169L]|uniref:hypothetical protein n=1 Tax=Sulfitobacter sp. F26169L TaxID=2996015 RepID=UPI002260DC34|nr:hypothetical protein [Sulfitobacter sp. F26169L]MCX7566479.1 hypothetical protein [Sulfitobacter sp. F26169L]